MHFVELIELCSFPLFPSLDAVSYVITRNFSKLGIKGEPSSYACSVLLYTIPNALFKHRHQGINSHKKN